MTQPDSPPSHRPSQKAFWTANLTELFERAAYYSVASFTVALVAFGELFTSPRTFEWIGALALQPVARAPAQGRRGRGEPEPDCVTCEAPR